MPSTAKQTTVLTSLLQRMFWDAWELAAGRRYTVDDVHDPKIRRALNEFVAKYLPEIRRVKKG